MEVETVSPAMTSAEDADEKMLSVVVLACGAVISCVIGPSDAEGDSMDMVE